MCPLAKAEEYWKRTHGDADRRRAMEGCATFPSPALPLVRYTSVAIKDLQVIPIELQGRSILPTRGGEEKEKMTRIEQTPFQCAPRPRL